MLQVPQGFANQGKVLGIMHLFLLNIVIFQLGYCIGGGAFLPCEDQTKYDKIPQGFANGGKVLRVVHLFHITTKLNIGI